jgi:hypothetical protein
VTTTDAYTAPVFTGGLRIIAVPKTAYVDFGITVTTVQDVEVNSTSGVSGKITSLASTQFTAAVKMEF